MLRKQGEIRQVFEFFVSLKLHWNKDVNFLFKTGINLCSLGSDGKHPGNGMLPRGLTPTSVVKPELYFPQCYAPNFNTTSSVTQFPTPNPEFKPPNGLPAQ